MDSELRAAEWRKSSYSDDTGNCVQVATNLSGHSAVRDSKNPVGLTLIVPHSEWSAFLDAVRTRPLSG